MTKKVIFITGRDPRLKYGGHDLFARAHARAAIRAGFEPHIFFAGAETGVVETALGVFHETAFPVRFPRSLNMPLLNPLVSAAVERFVLSQPDPQLMHGFGVWGYTGVTVSRRLWRRGRQDIPLVSSYTTVEHEASVKQRMIGAVGNRRQRGKEWVEYLWARTVLPRYEREQFLNARLVLVNYESVRRIITAGFGSSISFRHMPYCAETAFRDDELMGRESEAPEPIRRLSPPEAPLVVAVSRHDPRKGVDVLLRALAALRDRGVGFRACLVGGGALLEAHRKVAEQLRLADAVAITGWVEEPFDYLRRADIFVLPSLEEGSGSVSLLEALQAGVAVVASNVDGIPEDVTDGESALLVEPGDVAALSRALERLLADATLRHGLARRGRAIFEERFSAEALTDALRQLYLELGFD
ncbi:MAG TPA: glycosyltransferase family 4 protein [Blastocatellia bacterium]|nr:glycosyltransferase family 4 protein [Blastocatellia bacterium]